MTVERKKMIYALCVKYDVIIVEDDRASSPSPWRSPNLIPMPATAYYFLQAGDYEAPSSRVRVTKTESDGEFLKSLIPR